jgi:hypothetical protein
VAWSLDVLDRLVHRNDHAQREHNEDKRVVCRPVEDPLHPEHGSGPVVPACVEGSLILRFTREVAMNGSQPPYGAPYDGGFPPPDERDRYQDWPPPDFPAGGPMGWNEMHFWAPHHQPPPGMTGQQAFHEHLADAAAHRAYIMSTHGTLLPPATFPLFGPLPHGTRKPDLSWLDDLAKRTAPKHAGRPADETATLASGRHRPPEPVPPAAPAPAPDMSWHRLTCRKRDPNYVHPFGDDFCKCPRPLSPFEQKRRIKRNLKIAFWVAVFIAIWLKGYSMG